MSRLEDLYELRESLRRVVIAEHSEHGLQGLSGLSTSYQKCLADIETLEALAAPVKGTVLDELNARRAASHRPPNPGVASRAAKRR